MTYNRKQRAAHGQNYIKNPALVRKVLDLCDIQPNDTVVEIGPGQGTWTIELAKKAREVVAVEIDAENVAHLNTLAIENAHVLHLDALEFEPKWAGARGALAHGKYKTFGSIPYNLSSQLIKKFLLKKPMPEQAYFVVQKEFAERVLGFNERTLVSTLLEVFYRGEILTTFKREDFSPIPAVDSVLMHVQLRTDVHKAVWEHFGEFKDLVKRGYTQPIKHIGKKLATELTGREWVNLWASSAR